MWCPKHLLIILRQIILLIIGLMTVAKWGSIRNMAVLRRMLINFSHHIILNLPFSCCLMIVVWRSRKILKIRNKNLRTFSHLKWMLRLLILFHALCIPCIYELFVVIKTTHIHLLILELFMVVIIVLLKVIIILVTRYTVLFRRLASEIRTVLVIC
jgi:transposase